MGCINRYSLKCLQSNLSLLHTFRNDYQFNLITYYSDVNFILLSNHLQILWQQTLYPLNNNVGAGLLHHKA